MPIKDTARMDIPCPKCGKKSRHSIGQLQTNPTLRCLSCSVSFKIETDAGMQSAARSLDDLDKAIRDFNKRR